MDPGPERNALLRIIDANGNRALEAARAVEEHARFVLEDEALARDLRALRHDLVAARRGPDLDPLSTARHRDSEGDVGRMAAPHERGDAASIVASSFSRLKESLRALEEHARPIDGEASRAFEALRYRAYDLERRFALRLDPRPLLARARLMAICGPSPSGLAAEEVARRALAGGANAIQLRWKGAPKGALLRAARAIRAESSERGALFVVDDDVDVALLASADGVHLGQEDIPPRDARRLLGPSRAIGISTHSLDEARRAVEDGADYVGVGPCFASGTKPGLEPIGLDAVAAICRAAPVPAFAIGGVDATNAASVLAAGAHGVAILGAIAGALDIEGAARAMAEIVDGAIARQA